ncbi:MAG: glycosyltransferase family 4 protein [Alphaproteobacteria bacterium]|nr:glycosyltransferase family 4 protein [Alphaproteobacteria bacterium]
MTEVYFAIPGDIDAPTGGYGYDRRLMAALPSFGVAVKHVELPSGFPNPSAAECEAVAKGAAQLPANATLLIDGLAYGAFPKDLAEGIAQRIIALVHHPLALETGLSEERRAELARSEREALALADHVIVPSAATKRILESDYGVPAKSISIAEPGTDPAQRATGTGTPMQLLAVGAVTQRKGYDVLVDALEAIKELDWRLTITGAKDRDEEATSALLAQVAQAGLVDRVTLSGVVVPATLDRFYESTDVFVLPSLFEGYGMVLGEAMARGLPIVCTTGGAAAETVPDGAAVKVKPGDAEALSRALENVLSDRKLRSKLADASWDAGRKLPTWNETARRVAAVVMGLKV